MDATLSPKMVSMASHHGHQGSQLLKNFSHLPPSLLPIGLDALYSYLLKLYPNQRNPVQFSTSPKIWLGGSDILDYVTVYFNPGDRAMRIPPHWHYVSMGLSDLHGDGRVHRFRGINQPSGLGFELTFRLKRDPSDGNRPPVWPAAMMQHLATYAFGVGKLSVGDFIKWDSPLDGLNESRIQHILLVSDPQLVNVSTPCGTVEFIQIVGVCEEERKAVQKWNVLGISELLRKYPATGGCWLITDLRRGESVFDVDPCAKDIVDLGVASEGSGLGGVPSWSWWSSWTDFNHELIHPTSAMDESDLGYGMGASNPSCSAPFDYGDQNALGGDQSQQQMSEYYNRLTSYMEHIYNSPAPTSTANSDNVLPQGPIHIRLNIEAAMFLPVALKGRLAHGRHFTLKGHPGYADITLMPPGVIGSFSTYEEPYACRGNWLHVQVCPELQELLLHDLSYLESIKNHMNVREEKTFQWPLFKLKLTILPEPFFREIPPTTPTSNF